MRMHADMGTRTALVPNESWDVGRSCAADIGTADRVPREPPSGDRAMSERRREQLSATTGLVFVGLMLAAAAVGFWFPG